MYHDSAFMGAHPSARDTLGKLAEQVWWPDMSGTVTAWVQTCAVCKLTKPQKGLNIEQRSNLYDRPFSVLYIDCIGPIEPADEGNQYIVHVMCGFTRFCWLLAIPELDAEVIAKFLAEHVFLDLAGFPMVLRSDRGSEFVNEIVAALNKRFGVDHAFGAAYHPQAQGAVEGTHQRPNRILKAYAKQKSWSRWVKVAQWAMRCSPQPDRAGYSPYELVTGLRPQGPSDRLWSQTATKLADPASYVTELHAAMQRTHEFVRESIHADAQKFLAQQRAKGEKYHEFNVGDWVFLKRPPVALREKVEGETEKRASQRLAPYADPRPYQIHKYLKVGQFVLSDATGSTNLHFAQPVHASLLIPYNLSQLEAPLSEARKLRLELTNFRGQTYRATLVAQTATGLVRLKFETHADLDGLYDLSTEQYRWLD